ncbi:MAG: 4Fe-4S binding protein, partial [Planctomycetes bacterium]|nr:4Fe-4S binding protein [Planctomycetota bacterium]
DEAIEKIKRAIEKSYAAKGEAVVKANLAAVDQALANLHVVPVPDKETADHGRTLAVTDESPLFVRDVTAEMIAGRGDQLPVSRMPVDGTFPTGTSQWEKLNIALEIPVWETDLCIQCNKCALVCPHAAIRANVYEPVHLKNAPTTFKSTDARGGEYKGLQYTIQVAPEDCTGCNLCVEVCPAIDKTNTERKAINMTPQPPLRQTERENYKFFLDLPEFDRTKLKPSTVKGSQFMLPLFEYSSACEGCGETPYVKLVSQLFGDRAVIANATGCSSIYGGNLPTTPWAKNKDGRGPAWCNSLFEDNAEFGLGFRLSFDKQNEHARELLKGMADELGPELVGAILETDPTDEAGIRAQRELVTQLKRRLAKIDSPQSADLASIADALLRRSIWLMGGDGWAYDIGFGGLDHVLALHHDINLLVLDTEVYANTGGQASKATPLGAIAKFAAAGKSAVKKDLGRMAMEYGHVYVAQVAMGASDNQTVKAFVEAESYDGPSLIIAYSHCIAHGINMSKGLSQQQAAVDSGHWILYRYDPRRAAAGQNPLRLDSKAPKMPFREYAKTENRFNRLLKSHPDRAEMLMTQAQEAIDARYQEYARRAALPGAGSN